MEPHLPCGPRGLASSSISLGPHFRAEVRVCRMECLGRGPGLRRISRALEPQSFAFHRRFPLQTSGFIPREPPFSCRSPVGSTARIRTWSQATPAKAGTVSAAAGACGPRDKGLLRGDLGDPRILGGDAVPFSSHPSPLLTYRFPTLGTHARPSANLCQGTSPTCSLGGLGCVGATEWQRR